MSTISEPRLFISHATKDQSIIESFIEQILVLGLGIEVKDVFCTSYDATKIKTGTDWRESIRAALANAKFVLLFISPYYKESEVCQNEMGACWVLNSNIFPVLIEPITYRTVGVLAEVRQIGRLNEETTLDELKDRLITDLPLSTATIISVQWTKKKREFLSRLKRYFEIPENAYPTPMTRDQFNRLTAEKEELETTVSGQVEEIDTLKAQIEALKKAKDKKEVAKIEAEFANTDEWDEFDELATKLRVLLQKNSAILNGIIFNDYFRKGLTIEVNQGNRSDIDLAVAANEVIAEDGEELVINWDNFRMRKLQAVLREMANSFLRIRTREFVDKFTDQYQCDFEFNNITFWRKVFFLPITFN
jgi:hypothetical protein